MVATTIRYIRMLAGGVVLLVGIILALPFVPGPGIPLIILGLVMLSDHFTWAKRTLQWTKEKYHHWHQSHGWSHRGHSPERIARNEDLVGRANLRD